MRARFGAGAAAAAGSIDIVRYNCSAIATDYRDFSKERAQKRSPKPELKTHHPSRHRRAPPPRIRRLHTNDTYLTSLRCSPGGSDCSSFAAFSRPGRAGVQIPRAADLELRHAPRRLDGHGLRISSARLLRKSRMSVISFGIFYIASLGPATVAGGGAAPPSSALLSRVGGARGALRPAGGGGRQQLA